MPDSLAVPDRIAIDAKGYGWRVWNDDGMWSMVPTNPDNSPIPQPVTWFVPISDEALDLLEQVVEWVGTIDQPQMPRSLAGGIAELLARLRPAHAPSTNAETM